LTTPVRQAIGDPARTPSGRIQDPKRWIRANWHAGSLPLTSISTAGVRDRAGSWCISCTRRRSRCNRLQSR